MQQAKAAKYPNTGLVKNMFKDLYKPLTESRKKGYSSKKKKTKNYDVMFGIGMDTLPDPVHLVKARILDAYGAIPGVGNPSRKHYLKFFGKSSAV